MADDFLIDIEAPPLPSVEKVYDFYVTVVGGMEDIALKELRARLKQVTHIHVEKGRRVGRIFFRYTRSPRVLLELRTVENVFALLGRFGGVTVGQPGLLKVAQAIGKIDFVPAAVLHDILHGIKEDASFQLSCTVGKGHRFAASELHQMARTVLEMRYDLHTKNGQEPYQVHVQINRRRALVGMQLSHREQRDRTYRLIEVDGDLPPSVAYGLGMLAQVRKHQVCLDIRCGGGTTLVELAQQDAELKILFGVEAYPDVVFAARDNAETAGLNLRWAVSDPEALPIAQGRIDRTLCNLLRRKGEPPIGLFSFFSEVSRVLKKDGFALVIAENRALIAKTLDEFPNLHLTKRRTLHLRGRHPDVYVLQKK